MALAAMYEVAWKRVAAAAITTPTSGDWVQVAFIIAATCAVSLPIGLQSKFFKWEPMKLATVIPAAMFTIIAPGFTEEAIFRAALLPHPSVNPKAFPASFSQFALTAALPLAIFVAYHLVNPDKRARAVFWDARFLALAALLGAGCTASYYVTGGSLVAAALTHWLPVNLWLFLLGGWNKVQPSEGTKKE
ncbi:hypothetical protein COCSUDRAFT_44554 [Coccomyxa subellipsoidea C-169]|uniref:CAAX prenyl protease 2/Lysostaphin resistance protein A-like domain-containing protein n=1 Tax=Coccomyxa subellipsoidea (strain C-169) TaxID=574566 RepID=I0YMW0_COCSC|nr:hypothetical protein COCSUDRAFT_44554 [Coccomyxa subellipsoidea C-169]EIE19729.1 hypothetical protein COCSUDRAFT_44554 [Coccomyxa subellipsoidea C-169]|eukprot:XP_005644273.1 hypothetical protein COCSUDRAFT_44554 [Coccomyxa subellipsoidea C-169]